MRTRRRLTWIVFAVCAVLVLEGLGWVSWQAVSARSDAQFQESLRLALWRMDSELTPVIAQEAVRPYFHYRAFYPAERAYTRMWQEVQPGELRVPSPLLEGSGAFIRLHFQVEPDGSVTSPQAPTGNMRDLAESAYVPGAYIVYAGELLERVAVLLRPPPQTASAPEPQFGGELGIAGQEQQVWTQEQSDGSRPQTSGKSTMEYQARQEAAKQAFTANDAVRKGQQAPALEGVRRQEGGLEDRSDTTLSMSNARARDASPETKSGAPLASVQPAPLAKEEVEVGAFEPVWITDAGGGTPELMLQRTVRVGAGSMVQGVWLDWPAIERRLLEVSREVLPEARLRPLISGRQAPTGWMLASIPVVVDPGARSLLGTLTLDATTATLGLTWLAVVGAIVAIALVLRASMDLSDRRGRFVSAVTHELRTPLTTFCLYTEMLADGMVKEDAARREYLSTLKGESRHLAGIVENVLDYSRLGQGARRVQHEPLGADALLAQVLPALARRVEQCGMSLKVESDGLAGVQVTADPQTVERILVNLVDNACKYAGEAADKRVHLAARVAGGRLSLHVRDHGPGVPRSEHSRVFEAFHRAARDANGPKSGLGLGLALAKGLAKEMQGDLTLVSRISGDGAEFRLSLPVAGANPPAGPR